MSVEVVDTTLMTAQDTAVVEAAGAGRGQGKNTAWFLPSIQQVTIGLGWGLVVTIPLTTSVLLENQSKFHIG